jgi:hypothetical protein
LNPLGIVPQTPIWHLHQQRTFQLLIRRERQHLRHPRTLTYVAALGLRALMLWPLRRRLRGKA